MAALPAGSPEATPSIIARGSLLKLGTNIRKVTFEDDGKLKRITEQGGNVGKRRG